MYYPNNDVESLYNELGYELFLELNNYVARYHSMQADDYNVELFEDHSIRITFGGNTYLHVLSDGG